MQTFGVNMDFTSAGYWVVVPITPDTTPPIIILEKKLQELEKHIKTLEAKIVQLETKSPF